MLRAPICSTSAYSATSVDVFAGDDFGDDGEAGFVAGRGQQFEAFFFQALEAVGAGARLERAAAEGRRAGLLDRAGRGDDLLFAFDGAGAGDDAEVPPPTVRLPARTTVGSDFVSRLASLYGARTGSTSSTPGPLSSTPTLAVVALVADRGDHGPLGAAEHGRLEAERFNLLDHVFDILFFGITPHDDDHGRLLSQVWVQGSD